MNRNKFFSFFFLFLFVSALAEAQTKPDPTNYDGTDWISDSEGIKLGYIAGYLTCLSLMDREVISSLSMVKKEDEYKNASDIMRGYLDILAEKGGDLSLFDVSVGQLRDGLDAFYADFSTRKIKIIDALYVVKMQINGKNPDVIAAQVRYLKMQPISNEDWKVGFQKITTIKDKVKALKDGTITEDELLKCGSFYDKNGERHSMFCYGKYK